MGSSRSSRIPDNIFRLLRFRVLRSGIIPSKRSWSFLLVILVVSFLISACAQSAAVASQIKIQLVADKQTISVELPVGSTVQTVLDRAGIKLNTLDRTDPPAYSVLGEGAEVKVIRVTEEYEIKQVPIPYEQQTIRNESLPVEKEVLIQKGKTGLQEITYRRVFEDGVMVSSNPVAVKSVVVEEPEPEIRMIGVQTPFTPLEIPGKIYYLRDGNVWKIEGNTANRRAVLTTNDLDGRIMSISEDEKWLLFTRQSSESDQINSLWAANIGSENTTGVGLSQQPQKPVSLNVSNVTQFADFVPGAANKIIFSTVEPRQTAPGWQANNDLQVLTFSDNGWTTKWITVLEANAGGVYGWWGTSFIWGSDDRFLGFSRADSVGIVDYQSGTLTTTLNILPLQTHRDWAWTPGITWGPDGKALYTIDHIAPEGAANPEESQEFDLTAVLLDGGPTLHLVSQTGMFAYPLASPLQQVGDGVDYQIAFLQAIFPTQSETSRYRLTLMDRDGSNRRVVFPPEEKPGLEPLQYWGDWSPVPISEDGDYGLAVIYQGNLWIVPVGGGEPEQITGDGLTTRVIWK